MFVVNVAVGVKSLHSLRKMMQQDYHTVLVDLSPVKKNIKVNNSALARGLRPLVIIKEV